MAKITIAVNIPDENLDEFLDAINWEMNSDPLNPNWDFEQCNNALQIKMKNELIDLYERHQKYLITQQQRKTIKIT